MEQPVTGALLRSTREKIGISVREVGRRTGLSHAAVSMLERGLFDGPAATARIIEILGANNKGLRKQLFSELSICQVCCGTGKRGLSRTSPRGGS